MDRRFAGDADVWGGGRSQEGGGAGGKAEVCAQHRRYLDIRVCVGDTRHISSFSAPADGHGEEVTCGV